MSEGEYANQSYWKGRSDLLYYRYIDYIIRAAGRDARSLIDVGSGNCPYMEWFDWIPEKVSVDIRVPYSSSNVTPIKGDIHAIDLGKTFDICTCFQVLEHVPEAEAFARRLLELGELVVVSVPYQWTNKPRPTPGHVHDPVDYKKLTNWMGREANYKIIVTEPFMGNARGRRLIALYDRDHERRFGIDVRKNRIVR